MQVYEVLHNPMYHESGAVTLSLHRTLNGAYKAMRAHRVKECEEFRDDQLLYGTDQLSRHRRYDDFKWWGVRKNKVFE